MIYNKLLSQEQRQGEEAYMYKLIQQYILVYKKSIISETQTSGDRVESGDKAAITRACCSVRIRNGSWNMQKQYKC